MQISVSDFFKFLFAKIIKLKNPGYCLLAKKHEKEGFREEEEPPTNFPIFCIHLSGLLHINFSLLLSRAV